MKLNYNQVENEPRPWQLNLEINHSRIYRVNPSISSVWGLKGEGFLTFRSILDCLPEVSHGLDQILCRHMNTSKCLVVLVAVAWSLPILGDTHTCTVLHWK